MLFTGEPYRFDPVYHGPFLYWTNAAVYSLLGDTDFTARLLPALFSLGLILLCFGMRRSLGRYGWITAALFIAVSPTFTYYGRFLGHDNYVAFFTLSLVLLALRFGRSRHPVFIYLAALVLGCFIATKACFYIHCGIFAAFVFFAILFDSFDHRYSRSFIIRETSATLRENRLHLLLAGLLFVLVYVSLYSSFYQNWQGVMDGVVKTISYWGGQQLKPRLPGPPYYYLPRLLFHEPVFYLAVPAILLVGFKKASSLDTFLAFWAFASFVAYSFAQEKVPWLLMHILLPMAILAGRYVQNMAAAKHRHAWIVLCVLILLCWSLRENVWLCFRSPPRAPHLLKYMATATQTKQTAEQIMATPENAGQVFVSGTAEWPLAWYLRHRDVTYSLPKGWQKTAVIAVADQSAHLPAPGLDHKSRLLRTWWLPDYRRLLTTGFLPYLLKHETSDALGAIHFSLYTRKKD